jgi:hypothetical protein
VRLGSVGRIVTLAAAALAGACGGEGRAGQSAEPSAPARPPAQIIFLYDRSTSITPAELLVYEKLTEQSLDHLDHGDRVAAMELLQQSLTEVPDRWDQRVPDREFDDRDVERDSVTRVRFLRDARDYLKKYTVPDGRDGYLGTDILSTLFDVAEEARAFPDHRTTVVMFSDMLQATADINMEGMFRMPPADWVQERDAEGRLPDLSGVCVVVAGARTDTADGQRVKAFWQEYFEATGATLLDRNYSYRPVRIPEDPCG